MIELLLLLALGITLLVMFLGALLRGAQEKAEVSDMAKLTQIVRLPGVDFKDAEVLLSNKDYVWLRANPALRSVARHHWKERRTMVLVWLRLLQTDVLSLWRLRRWLAGMDVPTSAWEEFRVFERAMLAVLSLMLLRALVWLTGPFAIVRFLRASWVQADVVSQSSARLLARVPASKWPEILQAGTLRFRTESSL